MPIIIVDFHYYETFTKELNNYLEEEMIFEIHELIERKLPLIKCK